MFSERYLRDFAIGLQMLNAPFGSIPQISHHGGKLLLVRQRRDTSIALTGMENSLLIAEALLPQLEGAAASILRNLQSGSLPETPVERLTFAGYVALSHTRTPRAKRVADDWAIQQNVESLRLIVNTPGKLEEFLRMMEQETGEEHDVDEYRQALKAGKVRAEQTNRAWSIRIVLEEMLRIQGIFVNMKWSLLEAHDAYFLTSDCPVGIQPSPHDAGSLEFFFPVSRKYCLCGRTGGGEGKLLGSDEEVLGINRALISQADRFVFSPVNSPYIQEMLREVAEIRRATEHDSPIRL